MSWIVNIPGKAEELLNKLDQNAATLLKKDKNNSAKTGQYNEKADSSFTRDTFDEHSFGTTSHSMKISSSSPNFGSSSYYQYPDLLDSAINHDEPKTLEHGYSEKVLPLDRSNITEDVREQINENLMLKNEIRTLNHEISLLLNRVNDSDSSISDAKLNRSETGGSALSLELNDSSSEFCKVESKSSKSSERLDISDDQLNFEANRSKAFEELRNELELYKAKTSQQSLELAKYRSDSLSYQLEQSGNELLVEESTRLKQELIESRLESREIEDKLDAAKKEILSLQLELATFRERSFSAEHVQRNLKEEFEGTRRDLMDKVTKLGCDLKEKENELKQARSELVARRSQDSWQSRVANLTSALVRKQAALEQAVSETAQLRLQLEKTKTICKEYNEQIQLFRNINDTDDVKAQVPYVENVFDHGIRRRVKQVYSSLDSVVTRLAGVLLRRYSIARVIVLFYLIVLHSIICFVLYSWTPDSK